MFVNHRLRRRLHPCWSTWCQLQTPLAPLALEGSWAPFPSLSPLPQCLILRVASPWAFQSMVALEYVDDISHGGWTSPLRRVLIITWPQIVTSMSSYWSTKSWTPSNIQGVESHRLDLSMEPCHNTWSGGGLQNGWISQNVPTSPCILGPREIHLLVLVVIIADTVFFECAQWCQLLTATVLFLYFHSVYVVVFVCFSCLALLARTFRTMLDGRGEWGTHHSPVPIKKENV